MGNGLYAPEAVMGWQPAGVGVAPGPGRGGAFDEPHNHFRALGVNEAHPERFFVPALPKITPRQLPTG